MYRKIRFVGFCLSLLVASPGFAQKRAPSEKDPFAKKLLEAFAKKYNGSATIYATFTQQMLNPQAGVNEIQEGRLYLVPEKSWYKIELGEFVIMSNGKAICNYLPTKKEAMVTNLEPASAGLNLADLFTAYEKGYKYTCTNLNKKEALHYIDLVPQEAKSFSKITLTLAQKGKVLKQVQVFHKNGNRYSYQMHSFVLGVSLLEPFFVCNKETHPDVEIVDSP